MAAEKLYLIDGSGFIFRAYHSLPPLTRKDGTPVGAVYGFINMMLKLMGGADAHSMAVIFDAGRKTFRNRIYTEYKAHRPPAPDDLIPQFPLVREATQALGLPALELADFEADDLIATYVKEARAAGMEVVIVSSDKDLMQLVGDGVTMYDGMKQKTIGPEQVMEKFGVPPDKVRDALSLIGDSSDNVPGVPGIGPKTAAELITKFGTLQGVLNHAGEIKQNARRETLLQNREKALMSYELIGLCDTVPLPAPLEELKLREPEPQKLINFLQAMEFKTLAAKFTEKFGGNAATPAPSPISTLSLTLPLKVEGNSGEGAAPAPIMSRDYELVRDMESLERWIAAAKKAGHVAFDTETSSLNAMRAELIGFSLCIEPGKACYVPLGHVPVSDKTTGAKEGDLFAAPVTLLSGQIAINDALSVLRPLLTDASVLKIGHNLKYDMVVLEKYGAPVTPVEDTMLISNALAAGLHLHNMDLLAERYLGIKTITYDEVTGTGKARLPFAQVALEKALAYAAEDADVTLRLWQALKAKLVAERQVTLYETIERPMVQVTAAMEARGIRVDREKLAALSGEFAQRLQGLEKEIYALAGHEFNIGSPKQLGEVLFEKLGFEGGKKSGKTGAYTTDAYVLEELAATGQKLPARVLDWRQVSKLKSTYTDALGEEIHQRTARVHTSYALAATSTGRLSSSDPNLQNIPIRNEEGRKIREAFIAEKGYKLISADYSQIELRLLAHIAEVDSLKSAFAAGEDVHRTTAAQVFGVAKEAVDGDLRRKAKTINFGLIYGMSAHGLAIRLGIPRGEAATYISAYFQQYPGIQDYMERTKEYARENGYVTTLFGRRCYLPGIKDKNPNMRAFSERAAINAPLQGSAADIIKRAMIAVERRLTDTPARMLLQVHDELVIEVPEAQALETAATVKHVMEKAADLSVPLTVETGIGDNWAQVH